jgi:two-component system, cell cycle response regulator DivK
MLRCFIVDDHDDTREGYKEYLTAAGYEVSTASDGEELRDLLRARTPDAILLDLQLPRVDGWELTRELKRHPRTRSIPIIVVSACVQPGDRKRAEDAGCDLFLAKPVDPETIREELHRLTTDASD